MDSPVPQRARPMGRPHTRRWVDHDATLLCIAPAFHRAPAVMETVTYLRAWMILDNFSNAQVFALDGGNLRRCRMSAPQPLPHSRHYPDGAWWTRDIEFVPFSRGAV